MTPLTRLQLSELGDYFYPADVELIANEIWESDKCGLLTARTGKLYWVSYVYKSPKKAWIQLKKTN